MIEAALCWGHRVWNIPDSDNESNTGDLGMKALFTLCFRRALAGKTAGTADNRTPGGSRLSALHLTLP
jgi:hypothetical protein